MQLVRSGIQPTVIRDEEQSDLEDMGDNKEVRIARVVKGIVEGSQKQLHLSGRGALSGVGARAVGSQAFQCAFSTYGTVFPQLVTKRHGHQRTPALFTPLTHHILDLMCAERRDGP